MIIKRKLIFDNPEQREFGVPWKKYIKYGAKSIKDRGLKRGIRKLRFKISDDIDKSIKANDKAQMALDAYTENTKFPKRPEVMKALGQEAKRRGIVVVKGKKQYKPVTEKGVKLSPDRSETWTLPKKYTNRRDRIDILSQIFQKTGNLEKLYLEVSEQ